MSYEGLILLIIFWENGEVQPPSPAFLYTIRILLLTAPRGLTQDLSSVSRIEVFNMIPRGHALANLATWISVLCAVLLSSLFSSTSAAMKGGSGKCPTRYPLNTFRACYYSGTDPTAGSYLGTETEPYLGSDPLDRAFGIDRDWGNGEIFAGLTGDISATWRGRINFSADRHLLTIFSSDGVRVYIDEELVLDKWDNTGIDTFVVPRELLGPHNIRIEWFEGNVSYNRAHLRLHWDRVTEVVGSVVSPVLINVYLMKEVQTCIVGAPWDGISPINSQVKIFNSDDTLYRAWQTGGGEPRRLKPSDPELLSLDPATWECFSFGFTTDPDPELDEIENAKKQVDALSAEIEAWTFGAIQPTVRFTEIEPGEFIMGIFGAGLYLPWWQMEQAAAASEGPVTKATDFSIVLTSEHDAAGRRHSLGACGLTFGYLTRLQGGTGASWVPNRCLNDEQNLLHEWDHQMPNVIEVLMGGGELYGFGSGEPPYPPCGMASPDIFQWYPETHQFQSDSDSPWCGFPQPDIYRMQRAVVAHHLQDHFDSSLQHYAATLDHLTGNHCDNGVLDTGFEQSVDSGIKCPPPAVWITSPADGSAFQVGTSVAFAGYATDHEEGDSSVSLDWVSDLDGAIDSGETVATTTLSLGEHKITASVADSGGVVGLDVITVTIAPSFILLSADGYKVKGKHTIDLSWSGAAGSVVEIYRDGVLLEDNNANDGFHTDATGNGGHATYGYQICEKAPLTSCSPIATVNF